MQVVLDVRRRGSRGEGGRRVEDVYKYDIFSHKVNPSWS
jgi:hypothetical protein